MSPEINRRSQRFTRMSRGSAVLGAGSSAGSSDRGWRGPRTSRRLTASWSPPGDDRRDRGAGGGG